MELLVDSGLAYTAIWVSIHGCTDQQTAHYPLKFLYLVSFFVDITSYSPVHEDTYTPSYMPITAVAHLDAAMAQLTVMYCTLL